MTLPPAADEDSAPPVDITPEAANGWRGWLDNEPLLYSLTFCVMVAGCLLVPKLLNNMIFVFVMLILGVVIVPLLLKKRFGGVPRDIDRRGAEH